MFAVSVRMGIGPNGPCGLLGTLRSRWPSVLRWPMTDSMAERLLISHLITLKSKRVASVAAHLGRQFSVRALSTWIGG